MSSYTTSTPKDEIIRNRIRNTLMLAMEKVALHVNEPAKYPLPGQGSVEHALLDLYNVLPDRKKKKVFEKANASLSQSAAKRSQQYGDLTAVNFTSNISIADQVKVMPLPQQLNFSEKEKTDLRKLLQPKSTGYKTSVKASNKPGQNPSIKAEPEGAQPKTLALFIDSLTCVKTDQLHKDEIDLAAFAIDALGKKVSITQFTVGKFKKGDVINLGDKAHVDFDLRTAGIFPQHFTMGFFVIETGVMHNTELVTKLENLFVIIHSTALILAGVFLLPIFTAPLTPAFLLITLSAMFIEMIVLPFLSDDISTTGTDSLVVDIPFPLGTTINKNISVEVSDDFADIKTGKYTAAVRWERTA